MKNNIKIVAVSAIVLAIMASTQNVHALEINGSVDLNAGTNINTNRGSGNANANSTTSATTSAAVKVTSNGLAQKINSLSRLTETERSVLTANLRSDTKLRLLGPEIAILSTIERVDGVIDTLQDLHLKLLARATTTTDASVSANLAEMNTKLASASAQITAAQNAALTLKPDQDNTSIHQTNLATLKDARSKVKAAIKDVNDARRSAAMAWSSIKGAQANGSVTATSTLKAKVQ